MAEFTNVTAEEVTSKISGKYELYEAALRNTPKPQNPLFICE